MERPEHQMPCHCSLHSERNSLKVTHLAHEDNIGILAKGAAQCRGKAFGMQPDLTMIDYAVLALMDKFDRVFNCQDMVFPGLIRFIDNGGKCR